MKKVRSLVALFVVGFVLSGATLSNLFAQTALSAEDKKLVDSYLVSVDWLKANKDKVVIIDTRPKADYAKGHIPGAVNTQWQALSEVSIKQSQDGWGLIYGQDKLAELFGKLGIDGKKTIITYNDPLVGWGEEGRILWTLRVFGLDNSYALNGGLQAWKAAKGEVTKKETKIVPVTLKAPARNETLYASTEYVAANLGKVQLLDVREREEFDGKKNYGEIKNGRIPGAKWYWFHDFYHADGTIKTPAELREIFTGLGFTPDKETIAYCTGGIRSGFSTIVLRLAGYSNAKNYNGSFSNWTATNQKIEN